MSDIVFLLLIYFLLTSSFVKQSSLVVDLPSSTSDKPSPGQNYVTVTADQRYDWNGTELKDREELREYIAQAIKDKPDNPVISLRVDKQAPFDAAAFVIAVVAENKGKIVILTNKQ